MEFKDVVKNRYACKKFSSKKVDRDVLNNILEAGRLAPTAKNQQEQRIYVVESAEGIEKIDKLTPCRYGSQTILMVCYDKDHTFTYPGQNYDSGVEDATIVATHMMLAATDNLVDSCWVNYLDPDAVKKVFELPESEEVVCFIMLGYADKGVGPLPNHSKRNNLEDSIKFI